MPLPAIPSPHVDRLTKFCGLLGSNADGERSTAANMATTLLKQHGWTWRDLVIAAMTPAVRPDTAPRQPYRPDRDHRALASWALKQPGITDWERDFLSTLACQVSPPSPKQAPILKRIVAKLEARQ